MPKVIEELTAREEEGGVVESRGDQLLSVHQ